MSGDATNARWERLCAIATLGVQRAPLSADVWPDASLADDAGGEERALLRAAAATLLWRLAGGRASVQLANERAEFPSGDGAEVSEAAALRLGRMLSEEDPDLVREWLTLAQRAGKRLPPHWVPVALDGLTPELCADFVAVLGPAATWLATRNRRWQLHRQAFAASQRRAARALDDSSSSGAAPAAVSSEATAADEERWLYGTLAERRSELQALRARDPDRARHWLEASWAQDPAEAREAFLGVMLQGLSERDEPFLESALDDRRKGVRLAAAECLARLPRSAYCARFVARLAPAIRFQPAHGQRPAQLRVQPPASLDKAAVRDGVEANAPAQRKIGERAFWLSQWIARVPPTHFNQRFGCDAASFVQAALANEFAGELLPALCAATVRHPDLGWIAALCAACRRLDQPAELRARALAELIAAAGGDARPALLEDQARALFGESFAAGSALLGHLDDPWTRGTTLLALRALAAAARADSHEVSRPRHTLEHWARCADLETARPIASKLLVLCPADSAWLRALETLYEIIEYRAAMRQELIA